MGMQKKLKNTSDNNAAGYTLNKNPRDNFVLCFPLTSIKCITHFRSIQDRKFPQ